MEMLTVTLYSAKDVVNHRNQKKYMKLLNNLYLMASIWKYLEGEITCTMAGLLLEMNFDLIIF